MIGASHAATIYFNGDVLFREEISCHCDAELPATFEDEGYVLKVELQHGSGNDFEAELGRVSAPGWMAVNFPGSGKFHVTALRGESLAKGEFEWETVHMYPNENTIVRTHSRWQR